MRVRATRAAAVVSLAILLAACGGPAASKNPVAGGTLQPSAGASDNAPSASGKPGAASAAPGKSTAPSASASAGTKHNGSGTPSSTNQQAGQGGPSASPPGTQQGPAIVVNKSCRKPAASVGTGVPLQGQKPPPFSATTVDCNSFDFAAYTNGKPTLVDFFASWCDPCHKEAADLEALYEEHHASGFQIVGVETQDENGTAAWFYNTAHWTFPSVWDDSEKIEKAWNSTGYISTLPAAFWIHSDGTISSVDIGQMSRSKMESEYSKL